MKQREKLSILFLLVALMLTGCSATSLQKAEQNTRLAGMVPGGDIIYLPVLLASTIAGEPEQDTAAVEEEMRQIRAKLPACIKWPSHKYGYVCPADDDWDEINAQFKTQQTIMTSDN